MDGLGVQVCSENITRCPCSIAQDSPRYSQLAGAELLTWYSSACFSAASHLRLFAVNLMRSVLRDATAVNEDPNHATPGTLGGRTSSAETSGLERWCIETLITQLSRDEPVIVQAVLDALEEASQDERCLRTLVRSSIVLSVARHSCRGGAFRRPILRMPKGALSHEVQRFTETYKLYEGAVRVATGRTCGYLRISTETFSPFILRAIFRVMP